MVPCKVRGVSGSAARGEDGNLCVVYVFSCVVVGRGSSSHPGKRQASAKVCGHHLLFAGERTALLTVCGAVCGSVRGRLPIHGGWGGKFEWLGMLNKLKPHLKGLGSNTAPSRSGG